MILRAVSWMKSGFACQLEGSPGYLADTTRSPAEVQSADATALPSA